MVRPASFIVLVVVLVPSIAAARATVDGAEVTATGEAYTVRWQATPRAPVTIAVSSDPAAAPSTLRVLDRRRGSGELTVTSPAGAGARAYFYVSTGNSGLRAATRVLPLDGASNFRDLGGYAGASGKHVVWGRIFRSNALAPLTPDDYRVVDGLGIKLVCDLRTVHEREKAPTHWTGPAPDFVTSARTDIGNALAHVMTSDTATADDARRAMLALYDDLPQLYADDYRALFARLLRHDVPLLFHCSAGKDRSGLAAALILSALGVARDTITSDYAMSGPLRAEGMRKHGVAPPTKPRPEVLAPIEAADPAYLAEAFTAIEKRYGSVDAYLETLGVGPKERQTLRSLYLE